MKLTEIVTPALIINKPKLTKNIRQMRQHVQALGVNLRPHGKTAKNIDITRMALDGQNGGITVSTVKEAEYFFAHGISDITYAVGIALVKLKRLFDLVNKGANIQFLVDSLEQVDFLSDRARQVNLKIPVLIELDSDGQRSGIRPDSPLLILLAKRIHFSDGLELSGVLTHAGASYQCRTVDEIRKIAENERDAALVSAELLRKNGLPCPVISVGSTPTAYYVSNLEGVTEIRAGVYMFQDLVMSGLGVCDLNDIAISVLASVIGHQKEKSWVVTDAGWLALSRDRGTATQQFDYGYGQVCDIAGNPIPDMIVSSTNQEHGIVSNRKGSSPDWDKFKIGDMVRILPNHACATAAMHDKYHVTDDTLNVIDVWERINGW